MIQNDRLIGLLTDPASDLTVSPILDADRQIGSASIDIRLGPDIIVSRRATGALAFDASDHDLFEDSLRRRQTYIRRRLGDSFHLQPGEFVIARSLEYVALPPDISAEALGRSSWGRLGLVIATATMVQPGFKGTITLELANVANTALVLQVGLPIAQLVFRGPGLPGSMSNQPVTPASAETARWAARHGQRMRSHGRYLGQVKPSLSQLHKDPDLRWAAPMALRYMVGVVGHSYSGRSSVINYLVARRGFRLYRMIHVLRSYAERWGRDPDDDEVLTDVGDEICERLDDTAAVAKLTFMELRRDLLDAERRHEPQRVVIEGFKRPEELEVFQRLSAFRTMLVDTPPLRRLERAERDSWLDAHPARGDLPGVEDLSDEANETRLGWLTEHIDERSDRRYKMRPLVDQARLDPDLIVVEKSDGRPLREFLKNELSKQERHWRQGLFEPDPLNDRRRSGPA